MNTIWDFAIGWLVFTGLVGFVLMGLDKHRARSAGWRIPERTFFTLALLGGAFGVLAGSSAFHHKNRKGSFMGVVLVCAALWVVGLVELARLIGLPFT